jgi:hypothetical protein
MPITFTNNWKNILDKLENILRTEFKGSMPIYRGKEVSAGNQFLRLDPLGSDLIEYNITAELREFSIEITYHFREPNLKKPALDHVLRQVSRVEALIHDNMSITLSDSSDLFNINLSSCDLDVGDSDSEYVVSWDLSCQHLANVG